MLVADDVYSKVGLLKNTPANKLVIGDHVLHAPGFGDTSKPDPPVHRDVCARGGS
jgi:hypothetical protein